MTMWATPGALVRCALLIYVGVASANLSGGIIRASGTNFVDDDCHPFHPVGWNIWPNPLLLDCMAADQGDLEAATKLETLFRRAKGAGFNTYRIFAHGVDGGQNSPPIFVLQPEPGVYNEDVFRAIDYLLDVAGRHGLRAVISPANNWQYTDSRFAYTEWGGSDQFFTDETVRQLYKDHLATLVSRVNTINGKPYKEDPAILSWNLYNEMRCPGGRSASGCAAEVKAWVDEMAAHVKTYDPNHMVNLGAENFFAFGGSSDFAGPPGSTSSGGILPMSNLWSAFTGQDAFSQSLSEDIDYVSFHFWPDAWRTWDFNWATTFIASQQLVAARLNKPLVAEEFGAVSPNRSAVADVKDPWYKFIHNAVLQAQDNGAPLQGSMFWAWEWTSSGEPSVSTGGVGVYYEDSTWRLTEEYAASLNARNTDTVVGGCSILSGKPPTVPSDPDTPPSPPPTSFINFIPIPN